MIGLSVLLKYPSHVKTLNATGGMHVVQKAPMMLMVKNGVQHNKKTPMMMPSVTAALWSDVFCMALSASPTKHCCCRIDLTCMRA